MDRRGFLRSLVGGVAATTAVRTWPFRVFSFPTNVIVPSPADAFDRVLKEIYAQKIVDQLNAHDVLYLHPEQFKALKLFLVDNDRIPQGGYR